MLMSLSVPSWLSGTQTPVHAVRARLQAQGPALAQGSLAVGAALWVWRGQLGLLQQPALLPAQLASAMRLRARLCV